jgi:hypothetical protein
MFKFLVSPLVLLSLHLSALLLAHAADDQEHPRTIQNGAVYTMTHKKQKGFSMSKLFASGVASVFLISVAPAAAQGIKGINLQWLGTQKVEQIIGDVDWADGTPTKGQTYGKYKVLANGLGYSFEHFDKTKNRHEQIFLFGDTVAFGTHDGQPVGAATSVDTTTSPPTFTCPTSPRDPTPVDCSNSQYNYHGQDPFAWSAIKDGKKKLDLHFFMDQTTDLPRFVQPMDLQNAPFKNGPIARGGDDIPNSGISIDGEMYMVFSTGSNAGTGAAPNGCSASHEDSYSVLVHYLQPDQVFQTLREISYVEPEDQEENPDPENHEGQRGHFLFTSLHKFGVASAFSESMVLIYGVGWFRCSDVYLALVPQSDFKTLSNVSFFQGLDKNGHPTWSKPTNWNVTSDAAAQPVVRDDVPNGASPTIGNISVSFVKDLSLWLMTYDSQGQSSNGRRAVYFRYAQAPWGPWSDPQVIYDPCDGGFGTFIRYDAKSSDACAAPPTLAGPAGPMIGEAQGNNPQKTPGTVFAPYMIERFTRVKNDTLSIYYTMSTWNPYTVVKMESDFKINRYPG